MNIGLVTIAAFLMLLPGVAFIIGVNTADKIVREIVFRNTPAEIGYVVFLSVFVHLIVALASLLFHSLFPIIPAFDAARLYIDYLTVEHDQAGIPQPEEVRNALIFGLSYFLGSALVGFLPGFCFGRMVRRKAGSWTLFFAKHRWMLDLIEIDRDVPVYARVVLKDKTYSANTDTAYPLIVEGVLRDSFFGSDGKLLYLVFKSLLESAPSADKRRALDQFLFMRQSPSSESKFTDQIVIEGTDIALARYIRRPIPIAAIEAEIPEL